MSISPDLAAHSLVSSRVERILVPMRDGVRLAMDVYFPKEFGSLQSVPALPLVFERTPYGIREMRPSDGIHADGSAVSPSSGADYFVAAGFIVVRQDCRGRGDSEGVFTKYIGEAVDGVDALRWLGAQEWCDGRINMVGVSYSAHTQAAAASLGGPHLTSMIMDSGGFASAYEAGGRFGGAFELKQATWAHRQALKEASRREEPTREVLAEQDLGRWFTSTPWVPGHSPVSTAPDYERFLFEQWEHENLDEYWKQPGLYARGYYGQFPDMPTLHISSWYDPYVVSTVENFQSLNRMKQAPAFLVLGPWTHGARSVTHAGNVDFGKEATLDGNLAADYPQFKKKWISAMLAGRYATVPAVRYFLMGGGSGGKTPQGRLEHGGTWREASAWPPVETSTWDLYLDEQGALSSDSPASSSEITYDFDPDHPVPSLGGGITSGGRLMQGGAFDQTPPPGAGDAGGALPLAARRDVVSFQTDPLEEAVSIAGPVELVLDFSSSAPDTDITAKLIDVYPGSKAWPAGYAMNITDGMLRCRFRESYEYQVSMQAGEQYRMKIPLPDVANRFERGHRIRLDVSSSNFPRCDVNTNTGRPIVWDRTRNIARNTLHIGRSRLRLTLLPDPD